MNGEGVAAPEPSGRCPLGPSLGIHRYAGACRSGADRLLPLMPGRSHRPPCRAHLPARRPLRSHQVNIQGPRRTKTNHAMPRPGIYPLAYYPHNLHFIWRVRRPRASEKLRSTPQLLASAGRHAALKDVPILQASSWCPTGRWSVSRSGKTTSFPNRRRTTIRPSTRSLALRPRDWRPSARDSSRQRAQELGACARSWRIRRSTRRLHSRATRDGDLRIAPKSSPAIARRQRRTGQGNAVPTIVPSLRGCACLPGTARLGTFRSGRISATAARPPAAPVRRRSPSGGPERNPEKGWSLTGLLTALKRRKRWTRPRSSKRASARRGRTADRGSN